MNDDEITNNTDDNSDEEQLVDLKAVNKQIAAGAKALDYMFNHASDDFTKWVIIIRGLRGLCDLAARNAGTRDIHSWHHRQALGALLQQPKHAIYDRLSKQQRSACYKLMDRIDDVRDWYITREVNDQLRWKSPDAVVKNCPKHLLAGGMRGHNKPKPIGKKKRASSAEEDRLRTILIQIITEFVRPANPQKADQLLHQIYPAGDPNDDLGDLADRDSDDADDAADDDAARLTKLTDLISWTYADSELREIGAGASENHPGEVGWPLLHLEPEEPPPSRKGPFRLRLE